jgi:hypothetical protein
MELTIDSDLNFQVKNEDCAPMVFIPDVDLPGLDDDSIINAF